MLSRCAAVLVSVGLVPLLPLPVPAADVVVRLAPTLDQIDVAGLFPDGILTLESASAVEGPWVPWVNRYTSNSVASIPVPAPGPVAGARFHRAVARDLTPGNDGFSSLIESYGLLTTVAGAGGVPADVNKWDPSFEGGAAVDALLSNPHIAMADQAGNVFIADKQAHAIRKVLPDGTILTAAGTGNQGNGPDKRTLATSVDLDRPNGLWVRADGTVYILDTGNDKVRRLGTDGMLKTLFSVGSGGIDTGRGLWVNEEETLAYVCSGTKVLKWTSAKGLSDFSKGYVELGNLTMDPQRNLVVTDRGGNLVYRLDGAGNATPIAGNGSSSGGGEGFLALETGLWEVRGIAFLPDGSYFLVTHHGSQMWYVDTDGYIHLFINGSRFAHSGDGTYFYAPEEYRLSEIRAVTMDYQGNLLLTENDAGYVRKVQFLPFVDPGLSPLP